MEWLETTDKDGKIEWFIHIARPLLMVKAASLSRHR